VGAVGEQVVVSSRRPAKRAKESCSCRSSSNRGLVLDGVDDQVDGRSLISGDLEDHPMVGDEAGDCFGKQDKV
jgi:hypothetical protein